MISNRPWRKWANRRGILGVIIVLAILLFVTFVRRKQPCLDFLYIDKVYEKPLENFHGCAGRKRRAGPDVELSELSPRADSIFFVETSGSNGVNLRVSCAIESAALHHPDSQIYFVLTYPFINLRTVDHLTRAYDNVHFKYLNVQSFLKGSPLEVLWKDERLVKSQFVISHLSDILRYAILRRFGGTYVDTDVIFIKPLPDPEIIPNLVGKEHPTLPHLAAGVMRFQYDHPAVKRVEEYLAHNFNGQEWGANGPLAISQVMYDLCGVESAQLMTAEKCFGVTVFPHDAFYAVPWRRWRDTFDEAKTGEILEMLNNSYTLHLWGHFSSSEDLLDPKKKNAYNEIASRNCPISHMLL